MDFDNDGEAVNVATDPEFQQVIAQLLLQLKMEYTYDKAWLTHRMASMAAGQGKQALMDGYIEHPPAPPAHGEL